MSSKMSFTGSAKRLWPKVSHPRSTGATRAGWLMLAALVILLVWVLVALWYLVAIGLFGIVFFPFRLLTRSRRKHRIEAARHRELLQAIQYQPSPGAPLPPNLPPPAPGSRRDVPGIEPGRH